MRVRELLDLLARCPPEAEVGTVCLDLHDTLMPIEQVGISADQRFVAFNSYKHSDVVASGDEWFGLNEPKRYIDTSCIVWLTGPH